MFDSASTSFFCPRGWNIQLTQRGEQRVREWWTIPLSSLFGYSCPLVAAFFILGISAWLSFDHQCRPFSLWQNGAEMNHMLGELSSTNSYLICNLELNLKKEQIFKIPILTGLEIAADVRKARLRELAPKSHKRKRYI